MLICEYVMTYEHKSSGKMNTDGRTDEMMGQQEQLSGSLTITELEKIYRFLL